MALLSKKSKATNEFVPIQEIRSDVLVLKDGSLRAILLASSLNFALKSADEQSAIIMQFQNFLNSLDFSIQICVQSRELDIRPYVIFLEGLLPEQTNELIKIQTREYIEFIRKFTEGSDIMTKNFFIVVPYSASTVLQGGGLGAMLGGKNKKGQGELNLENFEESRTQVEQRVSVVVQGLARTGVRAARLGTEELIEVFYKIFNPGDLGQPITQHAKEEK